MTLPFAGFPSIEGFHNVVKLVASYPHLATGPIIYRGKNKQHGTNAGIRIFNGEVAAQSRTQIITPQSDNAGFARWVESNLDYWKSLTHKEEMTIFGEWCGPGIMKGTAINQIPNKIFAVFAIMIGDVGVDPDAQFPKEDNNLFIVNPEEIQALLGQLPSDVFVLPWTNQVPFIVDFSLGKEHLQGVADLLNNVVKEVEPCDPWVKSVFGVEGTAEGIVYYPDFGELLKRKVFANFSFKAKGEKHKVTKTKESVQIDPQTAKTIGDFVTTFVTEARLEQGLAAIGGSLEMKNIGPFLKWMGSDIAKESVAELEASDLEWSQVQSAVQTAARTWFISKNKAI